MKLLFIKLHATYASCPTHYISQQTQMDDGICFKYLDWKAVAEHSLPGLWQSAAARASEADKFSTAWLAPLMDASCLMQPPVPTVYPLQEQKYTRTMLPHRNQRKNWIITNNPMSIISWRQICLFSLLCRYYRTTTIQKLFMHIDQNVGITLQ